MRYATKVVVVQGVCVLRSTHEAKHAYIPYLPPPIPSLRLENFNHCNYQLLPAGYSMHSIAKKPVFDFLDNVSDIINKRSPTTWTPFFNLHCFPAIVTNEAKLARGDHPKLANRKAAQKLGILLKVCLQRSPMRGRLHVMPLKHNLYFQKKDIYL
jgi:hypothetical protein